MAKAKPSARDFDLPVRRFTTQRAFGAWLAKNHRSAGIWIQFAKAASGITSIKYAEAVEEALCWGWIDGLTKRLDDDWYVQRFVPRRPRSVWSKINRAKAEALIASGKMQVPGLDEVERARQDGRWDAAYDSPSRATVPEDLAIALRRNRAASAFFDMLDPRNRYTILFRVQTAASPALRSRRIREFVEMLAARRKVCD